MRRTRKVDETMDISEMTPLERISLYFRYANDPNNERLLHSLIDSGEEAIVLAENIFKRLTADDIAYERMEAREKFIHRYQTDLFLAREDGVAQGRNEGEASGRAAVAKALKAKGYAAEEIAELTGLPIEDIEKL